MLSTLAATTPVKYQPLGVCVYSWRMQNTARQNHNRLATLCCRFSLSYSPSLNECNWGGSSRGWRANTHTHTQTQWQRWPGVLCCMVTGSPAHIISLTLVTQEPNETELRQVVNCEELCVCAQFNFCFPPSNSHCIMGTFCCQTWQHASQRHSPYSWIRLLQLIKKEENIVKLFVHIQQRSMQTEWLLTQSVTSSISTQPVMDETKKTSSCKQTESMKQIDR